MSELQFSPTDKTPSEEADVCIIGGGIAGGITAYSLAQDGYDVVILEAGPWFDQINIQERLEKNLRSEHSRPEPWGEGIDPARDRYSQSTPDDVHISLNSQRLKGVGGTTMHWSAHVPRLHEKDFNMNSLHGVGTDWPFDYEDLQPYYLEAEHEIGVAGGGDNPFLPREGPPPMDAHPTSYTDKIFQDACESLGIQTHSMPLAINTESYDGRSQCVGFGACSTCPSGAKYTGDVHIRKALEEGARIIDEVHVQKLTHDSAGETVEAAVYVTEDGEEYTQDADQFVIACGGIETPRLLLLSKSEQYPDGLANSSGTVGKYLHATPSASVRGELDRQLNSEPINYPTLISDQFYDLGDERAGSVFMRFRNEDPYNPLSELTSQSAREAVIGAQWGDELLDKSRTQNNSLRIGSHVDMKPLERNQVTLNENELDKFGNPVPHITYSIGDYGIANGEYAISIMKDILEEIGATNISTSGADGDSLGGSHHKGTTRMGHDESESVVNEKLRTHDLNNLWISSSSVFPTGGAVNPTLTIAALSLKAADYISAEI